MIANLLGVTRYGFALFFGLSVAILFSNVEKSKKNSKAIIIFAIIALATQILFWQNFGVDLTTKFYPLIIHLPVVLFITYYLKIPWLISLVSVLSSYLCCQFPRWFGEFVGVILKTPYTENITYIIAVLFTYFFLKRYVAFGVHRITENTLSSCMLFGAVPFFYYIFDYSSSIYTDWLYNGSRAAVHFMPSVISTFYFVFIIIYDAETKKNSDFQRVKKILEVQLAHAKTEFLNLRQMQERALEYRHDMHHHFSLISSYASEGNLEKIIDYLNIAQNDVENITPKRFCENETVNLILSCFDKKAKDVGVNLFTDIILSEELNISDTELCSLISNALENAITAAKEVVEKPLRKVYFRSIVNGDNFLISTENAYEGIIKTKDDLPLSQRGEKGHGYGIKSMTSIVNRYNGLYSFETTGNIFLLQLMIPLKKIEN